jgi:predicted dehydrogenase
VAGQVRIGLIGAGWWGTQYHIPSLLAYPKAELVGVADLDPAKREGVRRSYGIDAVFESHTDLIERARPQGVIVAVQHAYHYQVARDALEAGVAVMLEKPMTLHAAEAWELVELARRKGVVLTVGYPSNYTSLARAAREAITGGEIGDIELSTSLYASMVLEFLRGNPEAYRTSFNFPVTAPSASTYSDPKVAGGGQGHLQVTHPAGILLWITGLRVAEVFAFMEKKGLAVDLLDSISVRFEGNSLGTLASTGSISPDRPSGNEIRVYGSAGSVHLDLAQGVLAIHRAGLPSRSVEPEPGENLYPAHVTSRNLVDLLAGDEETCAPGELGARVVELLDAAYRSAESGTAIKVRPLSD